MKGLHLKNTGIVILLFMLCGNFCAKTPQHLESGILTFFTGEVSLNGMKVNPGTEVKNGDTISTSAKSSAVIQIGETGIIALKENSSLKIDLLKFSDGIITLNTALEKGYIFNKLMKQSGSYTVKTPAVTAAVRGTSFSVSADDKGLSEVKLLTGSVEVKHNASDKTLILAEKEMAASSADDLHPAVKLADEDSAELQALDTIKLLPSEKINKLIKEQKTDEEVVPGAAIPVITESDEVKDDATTPKTTLADIEKKYGPLSRVILSSGKEYIGSFRQAGDKMEIVTVNGTVKVPAASVSNVQPYKK